MAQLMPLPLTVSCFSKSQTLVLILCDTIVGFIFFLLSALEVFVWLCGTILIFVYNNTEHRVWLSRLFTYCSVTNVWHKQSLFTTYCVSLSLRQFSRETDYIAKNVAHYLKPRPRTNEIKEVSNVVKCGLYAVERHWVEQPWSSVINQSTDTLALCTVINTRVKVRKLS